MEKRQDGYYVQFVSNQSRKKQQLEKIRIVILSDTHNLHHSYIKNGKSFPSGDILLHAGDFSNYGLPHEAIQFDGFLRSIKTQFKAIYVIPGNHENWCDWIAPYLSHCTLFLRNKSAKFECPNQQTIQLYGTRFKPFWSLPLMRDSMSQQSFDHIPLGTNIVMSHQPMFDILDHYGDHPGNKQLRKRVEIVKPDIFVCGHNHDEGRSMEIVNLENDHQILCINAAMDLGNGTLGLPIILDYFV